MKNLLSILKTIFIFVIYMLFMGTVGAYFAWQERKEQGLKEYCNGEDWEP